MNNKLICPPKKTYVQNLLPSNQTQLSVIIPANTYHYNYDLLRNFNLDASKFNQITKVESSIDTAGLNNVVNTETLLVDGASVSLFSGYYTISDLQSLLSVVIPTSGANSFHTINTLSIAFPVNSQTAYILGYSNSINSPAFTIIAGTLSPNAVNFTVDKDLIQISCSIIDIANEGGVSNYLISIPVTQPSGYINQYKSYCLKPIRTLTFNQIGFGIFDKYGSPITIQSNIILIITLTTWDK